LKGVLSEEIYHEEEVDPSIIFYLTLASEIMRGIPGPILLENRQCVDELVKLILPFDKCIMAFNVHLFFIGNDTLLLFFI
jgi:hypothetical protein